MVTSNHNNGFSVKKPRASNGFHGFGAPVFRQPSTNGNSKPSPNGHAQNGHSLQIGGLSQAGLFGMKPFSTLQRIKGQPFRRGLAIDGWTMDITAKDDEQMVLALVDYWTGIGKNGQVRVGKPRLVKNDDGSVAIRFSARKMGEALCLDARRVRDTIKSLGKKKLLHVSKEWRGSTHIYILSLNWSEIERAYCKKIGIPDRMSAWQTGCKKGYEEKRNALRASGVLRSPLQSWPGRKFQGVFVPDWAMRVTKKAGAKKLLGQLDHVLRFDPQAGDKNHRTKVVTAQFLGRRLRKSQSQVWRLVKSVKSAGLVTAEQEFDDDNGRTSGYEMGLRWRKIEMLFVVGD